jgi:spore maturation protein CgeB
MVRGLPLNELYSSTKIVVGDSQPSPHYWSNRLYETLGRGGFLLHPHTEGIETEFEDGKHLVLYDRNDLQDLYDKIDYYLSHDNARETIRRAGFVKGKYTYKDRCRELMKNYE